MRTVVIITLLGALAAPAAAQDATQNRIVRAALLELEQLERERERQREQAERERERQREQAERERERQREQLEREREQAARERERERARAERERGQQRGEGFQDTERTTRTFRLGANGELHLANISGDIVISRVNGNDAHVEIIKTARGRSNEDAKELLGLVQIEVVERANRAEVKTRYPQGDEMRRNRRNVSVSVAFNVTVPAGTRVHVNSISGSMSATDVKGDLVLKSVSGTVRLANVTGGTADAGSLSGDIEVTGTELAGALSASSASGNIVMKRVKARKVGATSISGNVILDCVECQAARGQSVSGSVQFNGALTKNSRFEFSSHSGNVDVGISGATGFEVEATSFSGSVRSDFSFNNRDADRARGRSRSLRGVFGDGSAVLNLSTFSGNISITKR